MKDEYKRRRKAERGSIRTLSCADASAVFTPVHQESLCTSRECFWGVSAQGNELMATVSKEYGLEVYTLNNDDDNTLLDRDSMSEISDDALVPNARKRALFRTGRSGVVSDDFGSAIFVAQNVIGYVERHKPGVLSTWFVPSGQCLESVTFQDIRFSPNICKINDTEFAVSSEEGHLCIFAHVEGSNLHEAVRIWKAHSKLIRSVSFHKDTILTTSNDWSARLWNVKTKKRLAVLNHDQEVPRGSISDQYIVTCSHYGNYEWDRGELRIYGNKEGYPLVKILRAHLQIFQPILLDDARVLCIMRGAYDENGSPVVRNSLAVVDIENECVLAQLKVACRVIYCYHLLPDGRLVVSGTGGCRGIIATPPTQLRKLIVPTSARPQMKTRNPAMCVLI